MIQMTPDTYDFLLANGVSDPSLYAGGFDTGSGGLNSLFSGGSWDFPVQDSYSWDTQMPTMNTDLPIAPGTPGWDEGYSDTLGGGMPPAATLAQLSAAGSENNAAAIARMQADVAAGGAPNPQDLRVMYENFGIPYTNADLGLPRVNPLSSLLRGSGGGASSGAGRGTSPIGIQSFDSPGAATVPAPTTGSLMIPATAGTPFVPLKMDTDLRGLDRLFDRSR